MAAKRLSEKPQPEYSSSSEEESSSDSDQEQQQQQQQQQPQPSNQNGVALPQNKFPELKPSPESDSDSDSDSESDSSPDSDSDSENDNAKSSISSFSVKPVAETKRKTLAPTQPIAGTSAQKKRKVSAPISNEDPKSPSSFHRVWSEEDEIAILKGMSDFKIEKGSDPNSDMAGFHDFIRKSLHVEASKVQLADKIRRLKKKFLTNAEKDDAAISAGKPHEIRSFELSKKVWATGEAKQKRTSAKGKKVVDNGVTESAAKSKKVVDNGVVDSDSFWSKFPWLRDSLGSFEHSLGMMMKQGLPTIESSKAKGLEEKWKKLKTEEMELQIQRSELVLETTKMVLDTVKSSYKQ